MQIAFGSPGHKGVTQLMYVGDTITTPNWTWLFIVGIGTFLLFGAPRGRRR